MRGEDPGKGAELSLLSVALAPNPQVFLNQEALQTLPAAVLFGFSAGFVTKARLIKSLATGD